MTHLVAAISHTPWIPERRASMAQLRGALMVPQMGGGSVSLSPSGGLHADGPQVYFEQDDRAHVSVWSGRMWQYALTMSKGQGHGVFLQDDDTVPGHGMFWSALRAILDVVPDQLIGLHLHHPGAVLAHRDGERFVTTMSCVGVGYVFPAPLLADFVAWRAALPAQRVYETSEDNLIDAWCIHRRRRVWHPVPTIVRPNRQLGSTGGGAGRDGADDQYMRATVLGWEGWSKEQFCAQLCQAEWWRAGLRLPPRHLVFAGIARPGVSMAAMPADFDGHNAVSRARMAGVIGV